MPCIFDELMDRMVLAFETSFDAYCQSRWDLAPQSGLNLLIRCLVTPGAHPLLAQSHGLPSGLV
jgi:hypothetical protein